MSSTLISLSEIVLHLFSDETHFSDERIVDEESCTYVVYLTLV